MRYTPGFTPSNKGTPDNFTGDVYINMIRTPDKQSAIGCAHVHFTPGARTVWHTHPKGQTLYVTEGMGLVGTRGNKSQLIKPGDVVYIEPGEEHWHGAAPGHTMSHIAMQEAGADGRVVTWLEPISDTDYRPAE